MPSDVRLLREPAKPGSSPKFVGKRFKEVKCLRKGRIPKGKRIVFSKGDIKKKSFSPSTRPNLSILRRGPHSPEQEQLGKQGGGTTPSGPLSTISKGSPMKPKPLMGRTTMSSKRGNHNLSNLHRRNVINRGSRRSTSITLRSITLPFNLIPRRKKPGAPLLELMPTLS